MPTAYPKCSPSELTGLLVLLNDHKGAEDVALLADDLDLEIDEILPSLEYAEVLQLVKVADGRATLTEQGKSVLSGSIRDRKVQLREQLKRTTLFKALLRALDSSPEHRLTEEEVNRLIAFTTAPGDEYVQNIINWGRYTELFRYDSDQRVLLPIRPRAGRTSSSSSRPPSGGETGATDRTPSSGPRSASSTTAGDSLSSLAFVTG
ncbi:MAG: AAA-associated domain-containing protein [Thermoplasmata archaeon]|nr:AAA-associated domain-containing protein [Thermoplasmata archaeon]